MKCLPLSKVSTANGAILHDWHAEVLAMRAFNRFLMEECARLLSDRQAESEILVRKKFCPSGGEGLRQQPFTIDPSVTIVMYCSEAPCGDASMELIMAKQDDAAPWPVPEKVGDGKGLLGRGSFAELGVVRRKPCMQST